MLSILPQRCSCMFMLRKSFNLEGIAVVRRMSSNTPVSKAGQAKAAVEEKPDYRYPLDPVPFSKDVVPLTSQETKPAVQKRRKTEILRMDPAEYAHADIGVNLPSILERRGEASLISLVAPPGERNTVDILCFIQQDIDLRPKALKRVWKSIELESQLLEQAYNPKRISVLGPDLSAAHFLVARKGKVKFLNQTEWVTQYRTDQHTEKDERDLPALTFDKCTMPVNYDPDYRVQAIDASEVELYYEGLANFDNLHHVTWVSMQNSPTLNDWGLDRIQCLFSETLEYLDLSGCTRITHRGLSALWKMRNLKTLVVRDLEHVEKLDIVCAHLEDLMPGLTCVGVDYEKGITHLEENAVKLEKEYKERDGKPIDIPLIEDDGPPKESTMYWKQDRSHERWY